jgi:D-sedoheptulose 7-phosphate isomerase
MNISREHLGRCIEQSAATIASLAGHLDTIEAMARAVCESLSNGGKLLSCGHGGSAAEALHLAEELVGRYRSNRRALPAVALVADSTLLTCIGNDFGFEQLFPRQVEALAQPGDVLVIFSTSGRAPGLKLALEAAADREMITLALLGKSGGPIAGLADHELIVSGDDTARIQEAHAVMVHLILEAVESVFAFDSAG